MRHSHWLRQLDALSLLEAVRKRDRTLYATVLTQALTGMRWQEVSALHREDIDWQERMIYVRRKAIHGEVVPTTKTGRGRQVGLSPKLLAELRAYLRWLDESDPKGKTVALLFFGKSYRPLHSSRVSVVLKQARADADSVSSLVFPTETATDRDGVDDERSAAE